MLSDRGTVQMLFDGVISMSIWDSGGNTLLYIVASRRSQMTPSRDAAPPPLAIHALVTSGAAIDAKNFKGETALLVAVNDARYAAAQKLLELGASLEEPRFDDIGR
jgi:ankyrin repeat protein